MDTKITVTLDSPKEHTAPFRDIPFYRFLMSRTGNLGVKIGLKHVYWFQTNAGTGERDCGVSTDINPGSEYILPVSVDIKVGR